MAESSKQDKSQGKKEKASAEKLLVRSLDKRGFRRAGMQFTAEGVELLVSDLTQEQIDALMSEPRLALESVAE